MLTQVQLPQDLLLGAPGPGAVPVARCPRSGADILAFMVPCPPRRAYSIPDVACAFPLAFQWLCDPCEIREGSIGLLPYLPSHLRGLRYGHLILLRILGY